MLLLNNNFNTNAYFNLALEEYFLTKKKENFFILWQNSPAVIVGLHQNTNSEINSKFIEENGIKVVRRMTGGGAVYHDLGNVNFTCSHQTHLKLIYLVESIGLDKVLILNHDICSEFGEL